MIPMNNPTKYYSNIQEERVGRYLNWGVVSGSGNRACRPGDLMGAHYLGECKTHTEPGHKISFLSSVWNKLKEEAQSIFKFPVLIVDDGSQQIDKTWCMFPYLVVAPDYSKVVEYPTISKKNVLFSHETVAKYYSEQFYQKYSDNTFGILKFKIDSEEVGVAPLVEFARVYKD